MEGPLAGSAGTARYAYDPWLAVHLSHLVILTPKEYGPLGISAKQLLPD